MIGMDTTFLQVYWYMNRRFPFYPAAGFFDSVITVNTPGMTYTVYKDNYNFNNLNFQTNCSEHSYFFKIGYIPQQAGIYSIEPHGILLGCPDKIYFPHSTFQFLFDLADCNKDVRLSIPSSARGGETGFTDVAIDHKEIFVFKVE